MTTKIHLAANKGLNGNALVARCAGAVINNRIRRNGRRSYQFMASEIVGWAEFKSTPAADRCAHCIDAGLIRYNQQRRQKGLAPVASLFE